MMSEPALRCPGSNGVQSVDGNMVIDGREVSRWAYAERKRCTVCDKDVKFRVRATDTPPWARILPHRTDGTPCR